MRRLSGGQAKRVALARALVAVGEGSEDDLLILDEPTNHLDIDAIAWLEERLAGFRGGLVLVTHDRHVLDRVTTRILELDRGAGHVHEGGYASYLEARAERAEREAVAERKRRNLARAELAWLRRGAPGPHPQAQGPHRLGPGDRRRAGAPSRPGPTTCRWPTSCRRPAGRHVVELHGVADGYGDHLLFQRLDLALGPASGSASSGPTAPASRRCST